MHDSQCYRYDAVAIDGFVRRIGDEAVVGVLPRPLRSEAVGLVRHASGRHVLALDAVALKIAHPAARAINLQFVEVRSSQLSKRWTKQLASLFRSIG